MLNISAMSSVLKVRYLGQLRKTLNNQSVLWSKIEKKVMKTSGKNFTIALHVGRTNSAGIGLAEYADLPSADKQEYSECIVPNKYIYSTLEVSGPAIAAARDSVGSFVDALESEVDGLQRDTKKVCNRIVHGNGIDILGYVQATVTNTNTGYVDDGQGNYNTFLPNKAIKCDILLADHSAVADTVGTPSTDVYLTNTGKVDATKSGFSIADSTGQAVALTLADGDIIVPADNFTPAAQAADRASTTPMGIRGIVSDADVFNGGLQGIAVAGKPWWQAQVFGNGGTLRQLDLTDMQEVIDSIATNTDYAESDISMMLCNYPVRRAYFKAMLAERRQVNTMKLDGGWKALDFNGMPFVVDADCRRNVIYYLVLDTMALLRTSDFDWMDKDGSYLYRHATKDAYKATLFHYGNLACLNRSGNGLLADILEA